MVLCGKKIIKHNNNIMFRGISQINLDDKGRLTIPTRYKESLRLKSGNGNDLVVTIDTEERCLLLYPFNEWEEIEKKIEALPSFNVAARRVQRLLIGHATETTMDAQGRILLPQPLRDYAHLDKHVVLVGQGKKFELWDEAHWVKMRDVWLDMETNVLPNDLENLSL